MAGLSLAKASRQPAAYAAAPGASVAMSNRSFVSSKMRANSALRGSGNGGDGKVPSASGERCRARDSRRASLALAVDVALEPRVHEGVQDDAIGLRLTGLAECVVNGSDETRVDQRHPHRLPRFASRWKGAPTTVDPRRRPRTHLIERAVSYARRGARYV